MPELVYRMLVTLLYVSKQWGYSKSCTVKFHLPFPSQVFFCGIVLDTSYGYEFGPDQLAPKDLKPSGFTKYRDTFPNFWWFAIGKQQWGFIEKVPTSTKYIVPLNIAITKGIYGSIVPSTAPDTPMANNAVISISANNMIVQSMQGSIASLWWLSIGFQQWGTIYNAKAGARDNNNNNNAVTFPMPFTTVFALSPTFIIEANHGNRDVIVNLYSLSNTGAVIRCWDADNATNDGQLTYIALGKQQWGHKDNSTSIVTFNLSFPTTCFIALVETLNDGTVNSHLRESGATNVGFSTWDSATNRPYSIQNYWLALGI